MPNAVPTKTASRSTGAAGSVGQTGEDQQTHQCENPRDGVVTSEELEAKLLAGDGGHLGGQEERHTVDRDWR